MTQSEALARAIAFVEGAHTGKGEWARQEIESLIADLRELQSTAPALKQIGWYSPTGHGDYFRETLPDHLKALEFGGKPMWRPAYVADGAAPAAQPVAAVAWRRRETLAGLNCWVYYEGDEPPYPDCEPLYAHPAAQEQQAKDAARYRAAIEFLLATGIFPGNDGEVAVSEAHAALSRSEVDGV